MNDSKKNEPLTTLHKRTNAEKNPNGSISVSSFSQETIAPLHFSKNRASDRALPGLQITSTAFKLPSIDRNFESMNVGQAKIRLASPVALTSASK